MIMETDLSVSSCRKRKYRLSEMNDRMVCASTRITADLQGALASTPVVITEKLVAGVYEEGSHGRCWAVATHLAFQDLVHCIIT